MVSTMGGKVNGGEEKEEKEKLERIYDLTKKMCRRPKMMRNRL